MSSFGWFPDVLVTKTTSFLDPRALRSPKLSSGARFLHWSITLDTFENGSESMFCQLSGGFLVFQRPKRLHFSIAEPSGVPNWFQAQDYCDHITDSLIGFQDDLPSSIYHTRLYIDSSSMFPHSYSVIIVTEMDCIFSDGSVQESCARNQFGIPEGSEIEKCSRFAL